MGKNESEVANECNFRNESPSVLSLRNYEGQRGTSKHEPIIERARKRMSVVAPGNARQCQFDEAYKNVLICPDIPFAYRPRKYGTVGISHLRECVRISFQRYRLRFFNDTILVYELHLWINTRHDALRIVSFFFSFGSFVKLWN